MVATSDVVVFGTVESAQPGEVVGYDAFPSSDPEVEDDTPIDILVPVRWREVTVNVEEQFYGTPVGSEIVLEQEGYDGELAIENPSTPWLFPGDRAVFFAQNVEETGSYRIMTAGEWVLEGDGSVSTYAMDPILEEVDGESWEAAVAADIQSAVGEVEAGLAEPVNVLNADPGSQRCG